MILQIKNNLIIFNNAGIGTVIIILSNCIKTDIFSVRAWRGHDCVLRGLKTLFLANFRRVERLKQEKVT